MQFIKGFVGVASNVPDGEVIEVLIKMLKKKIGQLIDGKNYKIPLDSDLVTFFNDKDAQKTIKEYEYLLNEKQSTLDNYIKYLDTACEIAKIDRSRLLKLKKTRIEIRNNTNLLWIY